MKDEPVGADAQAAAEGTVAANTVPTIGTNLVLLSRSKTKKNQVRIMVQL